MYKISGDLLSNCLIHMEQLKKILEARTLVPNLPKIITKNNKNLLKILDEDINKLKEYNL